MFFSVQRFSFLTCFDQKMKRREELRNKAKEKVVTLAAPPPPPPLPAPPPSGVSGDVGKVHG